MDKIVGEINEATGALIVSAPGAGKTLVTVEVLRKLAPAVTLVIAPPSTHESAWGNTVRSQGLADGVKVLIGTAPGKRNFEDLRWGKPGVYITSAAWFTQQDWKGFEFDAIVVDEVHMLAKYGNQGQKKLLGFRKSPGVTAPIRIALSGTPFRNNFENAWTIARWIQPDSVLEEYWVWRPLKCAGKYDHFAPQNLKVTGERTPGELISQFRVYINHQQRTQCCDFHPNGFLGHLDEPIRIRRVLKMTADQASFYRTMEESYVGFLSTPGADGKVPIIAQLPITARGMLRFCALGVPSIDPITEKLFFEDDCHSPKLDAAIEDIENLDGKRVLLLTHSQKFADVAAKRLNASGIRTEAWTGKTSKAKRGEVLSDFQSGEIDAIVGVISAMGTGTDGLQKAAYNVLWLSVDDDASNNTQGVGRLDRLGQEHQVTMIEYSMANTFDVGHLGKQLQRMLDMNKSLEQK